MRLGVWTPLPHTVPPGHILGEGADDDYLQLALDVVQGAERFGFDITLVAERFMGPDLESWILSTFLAAKTSRIKIMPAVHPGIMNPQVVAKLAATLDQISSGRAALNIVNGWWKQEFDNFSNGGWLDSSDARYRRTAEFIDLLHAMWANEKTTFEGEFYRTDEVALPSKPTQLRAPGIYATSGSEAGREVVARCADVWFVFTATNSASGGPAVFARDFDEQLAVTRQEAADMRRRAGNHGRTIGIGTNGLVICTDSEHEANERADALAEYAAQGPIQAIAASGIPLIGTPEQIERRIRALADAGVDLLLLKFAPMLDGLEAFGTTVVPRLHDLVRAS